MLFINYIHSLLIWKQMICPKFTVAHVTLQWTGATKILWWYFYFFQQTITKRNVQWFKFMQTYGTSKTKNNNIISECCSAEWSDCLSLSWRSTLWPSLKYCWLLFCLCCFPDCILDHSIQVCPVLFVSASYLCPVLPLSAAFFLRQGWQ